MESKIYCVLIDADNVSQKYVKGIFDEVAKYGVTPIRRLFGDVTDISKKNWKDVSLEYSLTPIQQYNYTTKKSATDSSMIIHTMDLLYTKNIDGFVIVSSDSDFTGLAMRIRENNKEVIGMGEKKTPQPFIKACTEFKYLENLINEEKEETSKALKDPKEIKKVIFNILQEYDEPIYVSKLTDIIIQKNPDFDPRNYGFNKMKRLLEFFGEEIKIITNGTIQQVKLISKETAKDNRKHIEEIIKEIIMQTKDKKINMGELNSKIIEKVPDFDYKKLGYSKLSTFLSSVKSLAVQSYNVVLKK